MRQVQGLCRTGHLQAFTAAVGAILLLLGAAVLVWQSHHMASIVKVSVMRGIWLTHVVGRDVRVSGNASARL